MAEPIACPKCGSIDWWRSWSGRFYEEQSLTWQRYVSQPHYELTFENEDQYDTDTEPWICADCTIRAPDKIQEQLDALS